MDKSIIDQIIEMGVAYAPSVLLAILTLVVGLWLIAKLTHFAGRAMEKRNVDPTIKPFLISLVSVGLKVLLLLSVAGNFGVKTTSFIAVLTAMAFAIGMALQGSLGNFASGIMILLFKPYKVGDVVTLKGYTGKVAEIQIFNTILIAGDNKRIILPNSVVTGDVITNVSGQGTLRVDMTFGISYSDDIDKTRAVIQEVADGCDMILKDKPVDIFVSAHADSSVNFAVRPWCISTNYWPVYFYMHEHLKKRFDENNINIPFPQVDVHMQN